MNVRMIYHTPQLHKLVEAIARVCYQSYDKLSPTSHNMVKGIMKKGHLSIASSGNMVFEIEVNPETMGLADVAMLLDSLTVFKQINNFVRWTTPAHPGAGEKRIILSMNMLTLRDIVEGIKEFDTPSDTLLDHIIEEVMKVPYLHWFLDDSVEIPPSDSPYISEPELGKPVILSQDYTALKELGLTDYELDIHATVTVDMITDRATGLQMWRHADMAGGCELSQRYVDRSTAAIREMVNVRKYPADLEKYAEAEGLTTEEAQEHYDAVIQTIHNWQKETISLYSDVINTLKELGVNAKRAKEVARSLLPNAVTTRIIQCRPLRQWKHFFELRDSVHAQLEIMMDAKALKNAFTDAGVVY